MIGTYAAERTAVGPAFSGLETEHIVTENRTEKEGEATDPVRKILPSGTLFAEEITKRIYQQMSCSV